MVNSAANSDNFISYLKSIIDDYHYQLFSYLTLTEEEFTEQYNFSNMTTTTNRLKIFHLNIRSLNANIDSLKQLLVLLDVAFDVIVLSEIWAYNLERDEERTSCMRRMMNGDSCSGLNTVPSDWGTGA
jgi:hypothetical protein